MNVNYTAIKLKMELAMLFVPEKGYEDAVYSLKNILNSMVYTSPELVPMRVEEFLKVCDDYFFPLRETWQISILTLFSEMPFEKLVKIHLNQYKSNE